LVAASTTDVPFPLGFRSIPGLSYQLLTSQNCNSPLTQPQLKSKSTLYYDWQSVGLSFLASSPHLGPKTRFLFLSDSWGFVDVGRPLWREDGSVVYHCGWSSPAHSFSGPSPVGLMTIFYCLRLEIPSAWKARRPYLYPPETGWSSYTHRHWVSQSQSHIASDGQSVSKTRYLLLLDCYGLVFFVGRPLWREDGSVFCICCWPLPAQSFSGPSPSVLATIFYCLRFETSLFVASYDSRGHGGGIRPRLHTGQCSLDTDLTENIPSIITCSLVAGETCHQSCSLATTVILSPVYIGVTWHWGCMSQYIPVS
jgi:hypothetical protein